MNNANIVKRIRCFLLKDKKTDTIKSIRYTSEKEERLNNIKSNVNLKDQKREQDIRNYVNNNFLYR